LRTGSYVNFTVESGIPHFCSVFLSPFCIVCLLFLILAPTSKTCNAILWSILNFSAIRLSLVV
jgi:hypothetical protein